MNVTIEITYIAASRNNMSATFPLRGRSPEKVALDWWKEIKHEMSYHAILEKVIANGEHEITQLVKELEQKEWNRDFEDNLPF